VLPHRPAGGHENPATAGAFSKPSKHRAPGLAAPEKAKSQRLAKSPPKPRQRPRKTDPIDDLINDLLKPIKLLRELKKAKQEIARLNEFVSWWDSKYGNVDEMEAIITKQQERIEFLENMIKFYEAKLNATS
jgi:hypothetical protein